MNKTVIILIATIVISVTIFFVPSDNSSVVVEPIYKQNEMTKDGCVMQESMGHWIKTCG